MVSVNKIFIEQKVQSHK